MTQTNCPLYRDKVTSELHASLDKTNEFILATNAAVIATNEKVKALVALVEAHDLDIQQLRNRQP